MRHRRLPDENHARRLMMVMVMDKRCRPAESQHDRAISPRLEAMAEGHDRRHRRDVLLPVVSIHA